MAIITGPDGTPLTVDSASLAIRGTPYGLDGTHDSRRWTYANSMTAKATLTSPNTRFAIMMGATGMAVRLVAVRLDLTVATAAAYQPLLVAKYSGAPLGTTTTNLNTPGSTAFDSSAPTPRAVVRFGADTPVTTNFPKLVGYFACQNQFVRITTSPAGQSATYHYRFCRGDLAEPVLWGEDEFFFFQLEATYNNLTYTMSLRWTEETTNG